jgi:hypothetical protein
VALEAPFADQEDLPLEQIGSGIPRRIGLEIGHQVSHLFQGDLRPLEPFLLKGGEHDRRMIPEAPGELENALRLADRFHRRARPLPSGAWQMAARAEFTRENSAAARWIAGRLGGGPETSPRRGYPEPRAEQKRSKQSRRRHLVGTSV